MIFCKLLFTNGRKYLSILENSFLISMFSPFSKIIKVEETESLYYWRTKDKTAVDFIAHMGFLKKMK